MGLSWTAVCEHYHSQSCLNVDFINLFGDIDIKTEHDEIELLGCLTKDLEGDTERGIEMKELPTMEGSEDEES